MTQTTEHKKQIAIFGGSFNPPHYGHFVAAFYARHYLDLDEVWMLVTPQNPHKDPNSYAPLEDRMELCRIMADGHPWLIPIDVEKDMETTETANTLRTLTAQNPDIEFTWVMGADNLTNFHRWSNWEEIIENYKMLVLSRPGEGDTAMQSPAARYAKRLHIKDPLDMRGRENGWTFVNVEKFDISSSDILRRMRAGERNIKELFENVEKKMLERGLFGLTEKPATLPPQASRSFDPK